MRDLSGLIPVRFLVLTVHIILTFLIIFTRDQNIRKAINDFSLTATESSVYLEEQTRFLIVFGVSLGLLIFELLGLLIGISIFSNTQNLISITVHIGACLSLFFFAVDVWTLVSYWYILGFCVAFPTFTEIITWIRYFTFTPIKGEKKMAEYE